MKNKKKLEQIYNKMLLTYTNTHLHRKERKKNEKERRAAKELKLPLGAVPLNALKCMIIIHCTKLNAVL